MRPIQAGQHVLEHVGVDSRVRRKLRTNGLYLRFLLGAGDRDVTALPDRAALFEGDSVERAAAQHGALQFPLLCPGSRLQRIRAGLAQALLVPLPLFCYSA
jgi:hypothetical protein